MATKIPYDLGSGIIRIVRDDDSYDDVYCTNVELNTVLDDSQLRVFEVRSFGYTILRVDELLIDSGLFSDYATVQEAYDDIFDTLAAIIAGIGGGGGGGVDQFGLLIDTYALAGTEGLIPMTNAAGTALIPIDLFETAALTVDAATTVALKGTWTYDNGAAGVGATLTKTTNGAFQTVDTVTAALNKTYLLKNEADQKRNGKWVLTTLGDESTPAVLTRSTDSDETSELDPQIVIPAHGAVNKRKVFSQTTPAPVIGTNNISYSQTVVTPAALILNQTVAQVQTNNGTYRPGLHVYVSNIMESWALGVTASGTFLVGADGKIAVNGTVTYLNSVMSGSVQLNAVYDVTNDWLPLLFDPVHRNLVISDSVINILGGILFPFDSSTIIDNELYGWNSGSIASDANLSRSRFAGGFSLTLASGSTFSGQVATGGGVTLSGTAIFTGTIGVNGAVLMHGTQQATGPWTIGNGKTVDLSTLDSAWTHPPASYDEYGSTFVWTDAIDTKTDTVSTNILSLENIAGLDLSFFGVFTNIQNSAALAADIDTITATVLDHDYELRFVLDAGFINYIIGGNIITSGGIPFATQITGDRFYAAYSAADGGFIQGGNSLQQ